MDIQRQRINRGRLILGGLAAGLLVNASGICLAHFVLGQEYIDAFKAKIPMSHAAMFEHLGLRLLIAFLAVFIYVGFRPRFGAGPRTAILAGVVVWLLSGLFMTMHLNKLDVLTGWRLWVAAPWSIVETCLGTILGAWIYRE